MAHRKHVQIILQGSHAWNIWRGESPDICPNLSSDDLTGEPLTEEEHAALGIIWTPYEAKHQNLRVNSPIRIEVEEPLWANPSVYKDELSPITYIKISGDALRGANLSHTDLSGVVFEYKRLGAINLAKAKLTRSNLVDVDLRNANIEGADLSYTYLAGADLSGANLSNAILNKAYLVRANLTNTNLRNANLSGANLEKSLLINTDMQNANLDGCLIHGISVWEVNLSGASQSNLVITPESLPSITVDNIEVAQFIYLLLNNERVRHVIDTITSKVVLILGRFTSERKTILDSIREELRRRDYLPVLFDFEKPTSRDITETISTLEGQLT